MCLGSADLLGLGKDEMGAPVSWKAHRQQLAQSLLQLQGSENVEDEQEKDFGAGESSRLGTC